MAKKAPKVPPEVRAIIEETARVAVNAAIGAEKKQSQRVRSPFQKAEAKLFAYPLLKEKLAADRDRLVQLQTVGSPERSRGIVRFSRSGYRVGPEEMLETMITDLQAAIAADEYEIDGIEAALDTVREDEYFPIIQMHYFDHLPKEDIAEAVHVDASTVWRNRRRLVESMVVRMFGSEAVK